MAASSSAAYPVLFFTQKRAGDDKLWVFYWLSDESKFGIASFPDTVYEMDADRDTRRAFLGNIAKSLVEEYWETMFEEGRTKIKQVNDESATVCYAFKHFLELPRVDDATARRQRIDRLVKFFVDEALEKKRMEQGKQQQASVSNNRSTNGQPQYKKSPIKRKLPANSRKALRKLPTLGLNFDDVIEEDQQRLRDMHPIDTEPLP
ncbi:hypothetical protein niasHS_014311 [Heterodera schachtii]|uniref:Uncharacterized protein n=1 Tax=Heterodera schachtii TaxID=97005 RepID=A0ABD2I6U2_HETSC